MPRINDGSFLFLQHMISKMKDAKEGGLPVEGPAKAGTRLAIVFNGSPLFTGSAGSGESEIRKWIIENDWLEGVVALPDQLFYNTGIYTYLWIVTNRKEKRRRGKIQLVNATTFFTKMRKSLGQKRHDISESHRNEITRLYGEFKEGEFVRIFDNADFGYRRITVERPLRLNFAVTDERLARLKDSGPFQALAESRKRRDSRASAAETEEGRKLQSSILSALETLSVIQAEAGIQSDSSSPRPLKGGEREGAVQGGQTVPGAPGTAAEGEGVMRDRSKFIELLQAAFQKIALEIPAPIYKAILDSLSERDETADVCKDPKGNSEPDPDLRDYENVPLKEDVAKYMKREVLPHVPDSWIDEFKTKIGYEINFNHYFYKYTPPRPLAEIEADLKTIEGEIAELLGADSDELIGKIR